MTPDERIREAREWLASRPSCVQSRVIAHPPGKYRLRSTGQIVHLYSYEENEAGACETCKVLIYAQEQDLFSHMDDRMVFGIPFADLEPMEVDRSWLPEPS